MSWQYGPVTHQVPGARPYVIELRMPDRGQIRQIRVQQLDGNDNGSIRLFSALDAAQAAAAEAMTDLADPVPGESASDSSSFAPPEDSLDLDSTPASATLYAVTPELEIVAGEYLDPDASYYYANKEGGSNTVRVKKLYAVIYMATADTVQLAIAIAIEQPHLSAY